MSKLRIAGAAAILALAAAAPIPADPAQDACGGAPCIQVGTFNIEHFGNEQRKPRTDALVDEIADLISDRLDLEVVVMEEIDAGSADFARLRDRLRGKGYELASGRSGGQQNVVIAWDTRAVTLLRHGAEGVGELPVRDRIDVGGGCNDDLRRPLAGHFRAGRFDFVLVGVHMKSQIAPDGQPEECADRIRAEQGREVMAAARRLAARVREDDLVLIGDFNERLGEGSMAPFGEAGFDALTRPANRAAESGHLSYLRGRFRSLIDHVMIRPAATREWVRGSTVIWKEADTRRHVEEISDHAPVWTSFATSRDLN